MLLSHKHFSLWIFLTFCAFANIISLMIIQQPNTVCVYHELHVLILREVG